MAADTIIDRWLGNAERTPARPALYEKHAGTYRNPALGTITVRWKKTGRGGFGELDAGEWRAPVARHTAKDGTVRLIIGAPLAGLTFAPGSAGGKRTLTLRTAQQKYVFTAVK